MLLLVILSQILHCLLLHGLVVVLLEGGLAAVLLHLACRHPELLPTLRVKSSHHSSLNVIGKLPHRSIDPFESMNDRLFLLIVSLSVHSL